MLPCNRFQVAVYKTGYEQLRDGHYIVDDVVDVAIAVMRLEHFVVAGPTGEFDGEFISEANVEKIIVLPCGFYSLLIHLPLEEVFQRLKLSTLKFFQSEFLVIPLPKKQHWTVIVVSNLALALNQFSSTNAGVEGPSCCFYVLDSLRGAAIDYETISHVKRFLSYTFLKQRACVGKDASVEAFVNKMKVIMIEVPRQHNLRDCGAFLMKNIELIHCWGSLVRFSETVYSQETITHYRQKWLEKFDELVDEMPLKKKFSCPARKRQIKESKSPLRFTLCGRKRQAKSVQGEVSLSEQKRRITLRIKEFLKKKPGHVLVKVLGDGNCCTRSALRAAGILDTEDMVLRYKQLVVEHMRKNPERFRAKILFELNVPDCKTEADIDEHIDEYLIALEEWGAYFSRIEVQALADVLKMPILFVCLIAYEKVSSTNLDDQLGAESIEGGVLYTPLDETDALPTATLFFQLFDGADAHYDAMVAKENIIGRSNARRRKQNVNLSSVL